MTKKTLMDDEGKKLTTLASDWLKVTISMFIGVLVISMLATLLTLAVTPQAPLADMIPVYKFFAFVLVLCSFGMFMIGLKESIVGYKCDRCDNLFKEKDIKHFNEDKNIHYCNACYLQDFWKLDLEE